MLVILLVFQVNSKIVFGSCPKIPVAQNFDLNLYLGKWYEIARSKDFPFEFGKCAQADYDINDEG